MRKLHTPNVKSSPIKHKCLLPAISRQVFHRIPQHIITKQHHAVKNLDSGLIFFQEFLKRADPNSVSLERLKPLHFGTVLYNSHLHTS